MAAIVKISSPHRNFCELSSYNISLCQLLSLTIDDYSLTIAAIIGSTGTSAIAVPKGFVNLPSSSNAFNENNNSIDRTIISLGGGFIKSNLNTLSIPRAFSCRIKSDISERMSSGGVVVGI